MKIFCTNAFTGEDFDTVSRRMKAVVNALNNAGHEAYCPIFDSHKIELQAKNDTRAIFNYAFTNIANSDAMVAIITSDRKSEGQLMEAGAALAANKPLFAFIHQSAAQSPTHLTKLAEKTFIWSTDQELTDALTHI